jgi:hypothetical protein
MYHSTVGYLSTWSMGGPRARDAAPFRAGWRRPARGRDLWADVGKRSVACQPALTLWRERLCLSR